MSRRFWWERSGLSESEAIFLQAHLRKLERDWSGAHSEDATTAGKMNRRRFSADKRRAVLKLFQVPLLRGLSKDLMAISMRGQVHSNLLDALYPDRPRRWAPLLRRTGRPAIDVRKFSFLDHPTETMRTLREIAEAEALHADARLNFSDTQCEDVGSFLVLEEMWRSMLPIFSGGIICEESTLVLERLGLRRALGWKKILTREQSVDRLIPLPFRRQERPAAGKVSQGIEPPRAAQITTEVVTFIDAALGKASKVRLTADARRKMKKLIGEVLDNAQQHATQDGRGAFTIAGFLARREGPNGEIWRFHLGFLSMGQTIAGSLLTAPPEISRGMNEYVGRHVGRAFSSEALTTVYALRDGVTRLSSKLHVVDGKSLGGTGLADILELFSDLSRFADPSDIPSLAIVSGSTYIRVSDPYRKMAIQAIEGVDFGGRELWFNAMNDPLQPPDSNHVYSLPGTLPGTLVTLAFNMNTNLFAEVQDGADRS